MSPEWAPVVDQVLAFLQKVLPGLLVSFIGGYAIGKSKYSSVKKELLNSELETKYRENEDAVQKEYDGLSGSDALEHAIKSNRSKPDDK